MIFAKGREVGRLEGARAEPAKTWSKASCFLSVGSDRASSYYREYCLLYSHSDGMINSQGTRALLLVMGGLHPSP